MTITFDKKIDPATGRTKHSMSSRNHVANGLRWAEALAAETIAANKEPTMHKNTHYNIIQAPGNGNPNFVVIRGQRTDAGHAAPGAVVLTKEMRRHQAIMMADQMQADYDSTDVLLVQALTAGRGADPIDPTTVCRLCQHQYPEHLGRHGCPNCHGEGTA